MTTFKTVHNSITHDTHRKVSNLASYVIGKGVSVSQSVIVSRSFSQSVISRNFANKVLNDMNTIALMCLKLLFISSQEDMADRSKIQTVLKKSNSTLRASLDVDEDLLIKLKATDPEVLTESEHEDFKTKMKTERVDYLFDILKRRPKEVFLQFMEVLEVKDRELYDVVKKAYDKQFVGTSL